MVNHKGKRSSQGKIAQFIYQKGITSKQEIGRGLGISMPTVLQCVSRLVEKQIVEERGEYASTGGRRAKRLAIRKGFHYAVGVDVTQKHQSFVLLDGRGETAAMRRVRRDFTAGEAYWKILGEEIRRFLGEESVEEDKVLGVGVSLPGIIDDTEGILLRSHILQVEKLDLNYLRREFSCPVTFRNDANSAAYGELHSEDRDTVYLSLSNTVGGALYLNSAVYAGKQFRAGEFGHMVLVPEGRECYCGKKGCMDAYCSALVLNEKEGEPLESFFKRLEKKEGTARKNWKEYLYYLAIAVANLRMAYDCDIMLGGYVGAYLKKYGRELEREMKKWNRFDADAGYLRFGQRGKEAAAAGAAVWMMDEFWEDFQE